MQIATRNSASLVGGRFYAGVERATYVPSTLPFAVFGRGGGCSGRARNARAFGLGRPRTRRVLPQGPARRPGSMDHSEGCPIDRRAIDAAKMFLETVDLKEPYLRGEYIKFKHKLRPSCSHDSFVYDYVENGSYKVRYL